MDDAACELQLYMPQYLESAWNGRFMEDLCLECELQFNDKYRYALSLSLLNVASLSRRLSWILPECAVLFYCMHSMLMNLARLNSSRRPAEGMMPQLEK